MDTHIIFSKMVAHEGSVGIESSIAVDKDLKWKVFIQGKEIKELPQSLEAVPSIISSISVLHKIMTILYSSTICEGNPDEKYLPLLSSKKR